MTNVNSLLPVIRDAIRTRKQLFFTAVNEPREFCPHLLGTKRGVWHVLGWQFGGSSNTGLPTGGAWRCIELEDISTPIISKEGIWYRGTTKGTGAQFCVDDIDTAIDAAHAAEVQSTFG
jgi:hypothetical protein